MSKPGRPLRPIKGRTIEVPDLVLDSRMRMWYTVDERLLADLKLFHIRPSVVIDRELRREVARRKRAQRKKTKSQIVNRFSGEILGLN